MIGIDLHTHSVDSPDGAIRADQYQLALQNGVLDMIAVTDHDRIDFALTLQRQLGETIIVGEEVTTTEGEVIGLFLKKLVEPGQTPLQTVRAIKAQGGLVYIPHPFETVRKGLQTDSLAAIADYIDIIEVHNGRAFAQNCSRQAAAWAHARHKVAAASSDAHGAKGLGHTYTLTTTRPSKKDFLKVLAEAQLVNARPPLASLAYPKLNRLNKKIRRRT